MNIDGVDASVSGIVEVPVPDSWASLSVPGEEKWSWARGWPLGCATWNLEESGGNGLKLMGSLSGLLDLGYAALHSGLFVWLLTQLFRGIFSTCRAEDLVASDRGGDCPKNANGINVHTRPDRGSSMEMSPHLASCGNFSSLSWVALFRKLTCFENVASVNVLSPK